MAFDISTAKKEQQGFDINTAQPLAAGNLTEIVPVTPEEIKPQPTITESLIGGAEATAGLISGIIAEPLAGVAGIAGALNPFADEAQGERNIEAVRDFITIGPKTEVGQAALGGVGEALKPVIDKLEKLKTFLGDDAFNATGSATLAALAATLPEATLELIGAGTGKRFATSVGKRTDVQLAKDAAINEIKNLESSTGIRQLTTDILPPESRLGKFAQQQGELIESGQRTAQQAERVASIDRLLNKFGVDDGARFETQIVDSVKSSIGSQKKAAGELFKQSSGELDSLGSFDIAKTKDFAQKLLDRQLKAGTLADEALVKQLQNFIDAPNDLTFNTVKAIRSTIGDNLGKAKSGAPVTGSADVGILSQLYRRLSDDMGDFAKSTSPELAAKWKEADKVFSEFAIGSNKSGVKNLIKQGAATPEIVDRLLFSVKNSDLEFLAKNLDRDGMRAAGQRVLQRILQKSSIDGSTINPSNFQTQLTKHRNQTFKFFTQSERKGIALVKKALEQTRRAQDAAVSTPTGQGLIPLFAITNPQVLIPGVFQAIIERPRMRNFLVKRNAAKTAKQRFAIDRQLQAEIDKAGLTGAATVGATTQAAQQIEDE